MDIDKLRAETPGAEGAIYLNNAGCALMPRPVAEAVQDYFALETRVGGYPAMVGSKAESEKVYDAVARLIGAQPQEIALFPSNTLAWNSVFHGMRFKQGDRILTSRAEYAASYVSFLQMKRRTGCRIDVIPTDNTGATNPAALEAMIDGNAKLIAVNWIPTNGGLINPAAEIGRVARRHGVPYLLDACQAVGQLPVDVNEVGCDYLTSAGRKWLRGPKGTGFLYVREERLDDIEPAIIDDIGAPWTGSETYELRADARRYETHENAPALRFGLGAAAEYALALGIDNIRARVNGLAESLRRELAGLPGITVQDLGSERAGLVTFTHDSVPAESISAVLQDSGIWVKTVPRAGALLDSLARDLGELVRVSPHCYNTEAELETVVASVRKAIGV